MSIEPVTYAYVPEFPHLRAAVYTDGTPTNPLEWWSHGIQFATLPHPSRTWRDYTEPAGDGIALDLYPEEFAEFAGAYDDEQWCHQCGGTGEQFPAVKCQHCQGSGTVPAGKRNPTLRRYLDTHTAAWLMLRRDGYDGTLRTYHPDDIDLDDADAIAYVSREEFRRWHRVPGGKPMPRGYRARATEAIEAVLSEYNSYATGDVYGIIVEYHDAEHCQGLSEDEACDPHDPDEACSAWTEIDDIGASCWGFIGYDYATGQAAREMLSDADAPEYRPGWEDPDAGSPHHDAA
jgi:hypothetical protein